MASTNGRARRTDWPADKTERWPLEKIRPYENNPRRHPQAQVEDLARDMLEDGVTMPILVDEKGVIIAGHGRLLAARHNEFAHYPVVVARGWSEARKRAARIKDNQRALQSGWDNELIVGEIKALDTAGYDIKLLGFPEASLRGWGIGLDGTAADPEVVPERPKRPLVNVGDVWIMGQHRLICGDSTAADTWRTLMGGEKAACVFTDPPYGVSYEAPSGEFEVIKGDRKRDDDLYRMLVGALKMMVKHSTERAAFYVWHASSTRRDFEDAIRAAGLHEQQYLMWVKPAHVFGRAHYQWSHEPCQPAGTLVDKVIVSQKGRNKSSIIKQVPIEQLVTGDKVVSFDPYAGVLKKMGRTIQRIGKRNYSGNMHTIAVGDASTKATADHRFTVRFTSAASDKSVVYLMKRGRRWRVGTVKLYNSRGFGLGIRLRDERADAAWIISAHDEYLSARVAEQVLSCAYGIPTTHWEIGKSQTPERHRTEAHIEQIYRQIGIDKIIDGAKRLLAERGLDVGDPLIAWDTAGTDAYSRRNTILVRARNLVPAIMELPRVTDDGGVVYSPIDAAEFEHFEGPVYSMDVAKDQHYVADKIVTHNCFYASKGQAPAFYGERAESTVWRATVTRPKQFAITVGAGVVLIDGEGNTLYIQARAPKAKKLRHIRIPKGSTAYLSGVEQATADCWEVARDSHHEHPTQKPVELARRAIENSSKPGEIVIDGFTGSGSTLIGAEMTGRQFRGCELDPKYAEVIIRRWERLVGQEATEAATGETLASRGTKGTGRAAKANGRPESRPLPGPTNPKSGRKAKPRAPKQEPAPSPAE